MSASNMELPQVGTADRPESHPETKVSGCSEDSGGSNLTSKEKAVGEVLSQATPPSNTTGLERIEEANRLKKKEEEVAFSRSKVIDRSPTKTPAEAKKFASIFLQKPPNTPSRARASSLNSLKSKKRRASTHPNQGYYTNSSHLEKMMEKIVELREVVKMNVNTKTEIKKISEELFFLKEAVANEAADEEDFVEVEAEDKIQGEGELCRQCSGIIEPPERQIDQVIPSCTQDLTGEKKEAPVMVTRGTQTVRPKTLQDEEKAANIKKKINSAKNKEEIEAVLNEEWPQQTYERTRIARRSTVTDSANVARVILTDSGKIKTDTRIKTLATHFPSLNAITGERKLGEGELAAVEHGENLKVVGKDEGSRSGARLLLVGCTTPKPNFEDLANILVEVKKELVNRNIKTMSISPPEEANEDFRKVLECVLSGSSVKAEVYYGRKTRGKDTKKRRDDIGRPATMLIKGPKEKTYAEMLKDMKKAINPDELGVSVEKASKTQSGDIRLVVREKKAGGQKAFVEKVTEKVEGTQVKIKNKDVSVIIKDLEETVTTEEVQSALKKVTGSEEIRVGEIRKGMFGNYTTVARMPTKAAEHLLRQRRVKIGWLSCRIIEKLMLTCCFKCQAFGHAAKGCKEGKGIRKCLKCGSEEHIARNCQSDPHCYVCKTAGHRADSMSCPEYRSQVKAIRKENRQKKWHE
jgi:hypothetical protein